MDLRSWYRWEADGLTFYKSWSLEQTGLVTHGFSARAGGVSEPPFESLNLGLHVGDKPEAVIENRRRCLLALSLEPEGLTTVEQVHGARVAVVGPSEVGAGAFDSGLALAGADAMVTNLPGVPLGAFYADCVPVFILDPVNKAIGLAHAGWKGTAAGVVASTLKAMTETYGSSPKDCFAAIGPAIGRCCYDVGRDTADAVWKACSDLRPLVRWSDDRWKVDLQLANWLILIGSGVPESSIGLCLRCASCHQEEFFSYRRDGPTGRMAAILALR